jgi:hypothetical protein
MASISTDTDVERQGIDRRTLIRRAAIVGAAAWTAPVIIGSLTSPAGAVTGILGCNNYCINGGNCNADQNQTPCAIVTGCTTPNAGIVSCIQVSNNGTTWTDLGSHVGVNCQAGSNDPPVYFRINPGCECRIAQVAAKNGNDCVLAVQDSPTAWHFATGAGNLAQICLSIRCP